MNFENEERANFFQQNKEGLCSTIGYLSIYLAGESICYKINNILNEE